MPELTPEYIIQEEKASADIYEGHAKKAMASGDRDNYSYMKRLAKLHRNQARAVADEHNLKITDIPRRVNLFPG